MLGSRYLFLKSAYPLKAVARARMGMTLQQPCLSPSLPPSPLTNRFFPAILISNSVRKTIEVQKMGKGKARERRQARTREAIIQAAQEIIETQGPDALNMRDVAELIDYSASNLYEYFASKDELLIAVANEALTHLAMQIRHRATAQSPRERLLAYGRSYLEFARTHAQLYL